ncbi:MAG: hypothetical protein WBQ29_16395 [Isosphaeraceae bacterium]
MNQDRIAAWRWVASTLIYPVMILPGLNATVLLISSVCVGLDSWSLEGALSNMSLGFPAVAGIAALWFSTHTPIPSTARSRWRFLLVTTGLMMGLLMECLFLKAGIQSQAIRLPGSGFLELWVFGGPLLAGCVNLTLLIWAKNQMIGRVVPVPVHAVPPHHLAAQRILRPVRLEPYRPPAPTRWCVPSESSDNRVDRV